jgi:hypothetical protein
MSTTTQGNRFRDSIKTLLELCPRFIHVQQEVRIAHQDVDIYYEEPTSTNTLRIACECKGYTHPLTRSDLERIYAKYDPLIRSKSPAIDAVRIFAPLPLGANAQAYLQQVGFSFSTQDDLELNIVDFRAYLRSLVNDYRQNLADVYTRPRLEDGNDAESIVCQWIEGSSSQPVAILGGYGMGKTSFASHLAAKLASARLENRATRIPILIPLSEISNQQSIEGLLGKLFSAQNRVPNYYYGLFTELNRRSRLAILLDGFDEMKHAMSAADLRYNFAQLHTLVTTNSRVLLLGRPSAFVSDSEEHHVLRGMQRIGVKEIELPGAPEYQLLKLAQFTEKQAFEFVENYTKKNGPRLKSIRGQTYDHEKTRARVADVRLHADLIALIQRPMQAKMIADLAIDGKVEWRSFNRFQLYEIFVNRIFQREMEKQVRRPLTLDTRFAFHQRLAWWLLTQTRTTSFHLSDLPNHVLGEIPEQTCADRDGFSRELLAGSLLDKKLGDTYHFPHRSFVEFLVAQQVSTHGWNTRRSEEIAAALTPEVVDFIREAGRAAVISDLLEHLDSLEAPVGCTFLSLVATHLNAANTPIEADLPLAASPRRIYCEYLRRRADEREADETFAFFSRVFNSASNEDSRLTSLIILIQEIERSAGDVELALAEQLTAVIASRSLKELAATHGAKDGRIFEAQNPYVRAFAAAFSLGFGKDLQLWIDKALLLEVLHQSLREEWRLPDLKKPSMEPIVVNFKAAAQWDTTLNGQSKALVTFFALSRRFRPEATA